MYPESSCNLHDMAQYSSSISKSHNDKRYNSDIWLQIIHLELNTFTQLYYTAQTVQTRCESLR